MKKIQLHGKHGTGKFTIVDDEMYEKIVQIKWYLSTNGYAVKTKGTKTIYLHRIILKTKKPLVTDHINRNKLDNRRQNLRACTGSTNAFNADKKKNNTSGYKGVTYWKRGDNWKAQIKINRKNYHIGYFDTREEAAQAYQNYL